MNLKYICQFTMHPNRVTITFILNNWTLYLQVGKSCITVKPVLSGHSKRRLKLVFKTDYRLWNNAGQKYCRMLQVEHLQFFLPSLSYHLSLRSLFCLFLSGRLRQVILYKSSVFVTLCNDYASKKRFSVAVHSSTIAVSLVMHINTKCHKVLSQLHGSFHKGLL